jgi:SSS family transporter
MKLLELIITILYFIACIVIALYFRRKAGTSELAFWGAERKIGFIVNGIAQFSALVSAASFLGFLGLAYRLGWSFTTMAFGVGSTLGFILSMLTISGPLRRYSEIKGKFTLSNFFSDRYGTPTALATTIFILILFPVYIVPQLMGGGLAAAYILGINFKYAVILVGVVYVSYVLIGGMLSVTWTDFLQGILMFVFMVGLSITALIHFGGFGSLIPQATAVNPFFLSLHPKVSPWTYFGIALGVLTFALASPHIIMRLFTARDVRQGRAALSLTAGLSLTFHLLGYIGVAAAALVIAPKLQKIDTTYIVVMNELFPPLIRGFAVAGILAAIMSTTDAMLLASGAEFSNNIYKKFFKPDATEGQTIKVAQTIMVIIGILTIVLAIYETKTIGMIVGLLVEGTGSAFVVPLIAGIWWKRANKVGGFLSCVGGFVVFVFIYYMKVVPMFAEILIALPVSIVLMILGSLVTAPPRDKMELMEAMHRG